jgi:hypothetical protein
MKFICVCILFVCTVAASFSNWLVIASFNINQDYIAKELCVNRNKPGSNCNGHCYLCKQLNKDEKPEGTNSGTKEKFEVQLFFVATANSDSLSTASKKSVSSIAPHFTHQLYLKSFFHPPSLSV